MNLMTLDAKITLDDASYKKGLSNAESLTQQFGNKVSAMTVAVGNIMADVMKKTVSTLGNVVKGAVDGYADYQQLVGGVETLFKDSAGKVAKYAEQSYKTTGLSANQYMETVTSFSASLLQGLGGKTEAAADIANTAVVDMADNANKMGTDISSIQAAYMGFAKQNFTLLDNLKLGYGGTRSEMVRLINDSGILEKEIKDLDGITFDQLVQAIHVVQTNMGITGTTAKEAAETISGSKSTLVAAWSDFLVSIGGEADQQRLNEAATRFKTAFSTYVESNLAPQVQTTIENAPALVKAVTEAITSLPNKAITDLVGGGIDLLTATVDGATKIGGWLVDGLVNMFKDIKADQSKIADLGNAVGTFIGSALSDIATNAPTMIAGLFTAGVSLAGSLIEGLFTGLFGDKDGVDKVFGNIDKDMAESIKSAEKSSAKAEGILSYMDGLVKKYGDAAQGTQEWKDALSELEQVLPGASGYIETHNSDLGTTIQNLQQIREELRKTAVENAKRQALESKRTAWEDLVGQAASLQADIDYARGERTAAENRLREFIGSAWDQEYGDHGKTLGQVAREDPYELEGAIQRAINEKGLDRNSESFKTLMAQLDAWAETLTGSDDSIATMEEKLGSLNDQIASAEAKYQLASDAFDAMTSEQGTATTATTTLAGAMEAAAARINALAFGNGGTAGFFGNAFSNAVNSFANSPFASLFMPRAVGIDYVPYSGFKTELHRGEAVITAEENARRRSGSSTDEFAEVMETALVTAMNRVNVYMSGEKVGDLTTKRIQQNINGASYSRLRSMGG